MAPKTNLAKAASTALQPDAPLPSTSGRSETEALKELLTTCIPPRKREDVLGSEDIFNKLNLARYRDAALKLRGAQLYGKLQTATPPVLYEPPG